MGIGALAKLGKSLGRELFGFLLRSDLNVAKIAEGAGITMDTLEAAPPEALSAILDRAARSGAIDPREANNINIQLAKDAQEVQMKNPFVFETHDELEQAMAEFSEMVGDEYWKKELARVEGKTNRFGEPMKPDPFGGPSAGTQGYVQYLRDMGYDGIKILGQQYGHW
jgi:hypothetical protein